MIKRLVRSARRSRDNRAQDSPANPLDAPVVDPAKHVVERFPPLLLLEMENERRGGGENHRRQVCFRQLQVRPLAQRLEDHRPALPAWTRARLVFRLPCRAKPDLEYSNPRPVDTLPGGCSATGVERLLLSFRFGNSICSMSMFVASMFPRTREVYNVLYTCFNAFSVSRKASRTSDERVRSFAHASCVTR